ncbi:MAG: FecR domain-containing protein [Ferruginibacter sp.]
MKNNLENIIIKYLKDEISEEENVQLQEWIAESDSNKVLFEKLTSGKWLDAEVKKLYSYNEVESWNKIKAASAVGNEVVVRKFNWKPFAAAASFLLVLGLGSYFLLSKKTQVSQIADQQIALKDIAPPKGTKAMIQLANGKSVLLDSINSGKLADQGNIKVVKQANGEIVYEGGEGTEVSYNTLVNPRGSNVVNITLQDGTKVWLNSESSIKYPTAFSGTQREVELIGEGYFEVAKDPSKKFIVHSNNVQTEVYGTHFNVSAYPDEKEMKITLLEGSVKVSKGQFTNMLSPGQQATVGEAIKLLHNVDTDKAIAWKNGKFIFDSENVETIMEQIGRWYGPVVEYRGAISKETFSGIVSRDSNLSQVLKIMQQGGVKFSMENKKIIVTQ